jgi:hypothetical protein
VMMDTAKGKSVAKMVETMPEAGVFRDQAMAELEDAVVNVARGLAEMHNATGNGDLMNIANKTSDAQYILGKVDNAQPLLGDDWVPIHQALEGEVIPAFYEAPLPASAYHGDANIGNFVVSTEGTGAAAKTTVGVIDVGSMKWSVTAAGDGNKTGAADVARFLGSFETMFPGKLTGAEMARLRTAFERAYFADVPAAQADFEAAIKLYGVELEIAALNKGAPPAEVIGRIKTILGL